MDAAAVLSAEKLGYKIHRGDLGEVWYTKEGILRGPYKSYDEAAYEALAEHEINEAFRFWKNGGADHRSDSGGSVDIFTDNSSATGADLCASDTLVNGVK